MPEHNIQPRRAASGMPLRQRQQLLPANNKPSPPDLNKHHKDPILTPANNLERAGRLNNHLFIEPIHTDIQNSIEYQIA